MTTPKPKLDLFNESPFLVSKKCRTSTPSLRPPKPPTKFSKHLRRSNNNSFNIIPPENPFATPTNINNNNNITTNNYNIKNNNNYNNNYNNINDDLANASNYSNIYPTTSANNAFFFDEDDFQQHLQQQHHNQTLLNSNTPKHPRQQHSYKFHLHNNHHHHHHNSHYQNTPYYNHRKSCSQQTTNIDLVSNGGAVRMRQDFLFNSGEYDLVVNGDEEIREQDYIYDNPTHTSIINNDNIIDSQMMSVHIKEQEQDNGNDLSKLSQEFEIICKIGSGYFADVFKAKSLKDNQYYAVKKTSLPFTSKSDRLRKLQEVKNHQSIPPHPNCVKYYDSWEEDGYLYIQTELCKTSLNEVLEASEDRKLPEHLVWGYLLDILVAVKHLHDNQLLHLDIKPDNIFISFNGVAKLGDFGLMCNCLDLNSSNQYHNQRQQLMQHEQPPQQSPSIKKKDLPRESNNIFETPTQTPRKKYLRTSRSQTPQNTTNNFYPNTSRLFNSRDDSISIIDDDNAHHQLIDVDHDTSFDNDETFSFPNDHDDSGIINRSEESIDSLDEGDSKYLASETMQGKFTKAADIFCLGITMFEVASGLELPQRGEVYHKLRHNEIEDLYFNGLSADLVKVIKMMMEEDYTKRPTVDELLQLDAIQLRRLSQTRSPSSSSSSSVSSTSLTSSSS